MNSVFDVDASKRATNLSINSDLLSKAKALDINLSATLEKALIEKLKEKQKEAWLVENKKAVATYNRSVEEQGVFSEGLRSF